MNVAVLCYVLCTIAFFLSVFLSFFPSFFLSFQPHPAFLYPTGPLTATFVGDAIGGDRVVRSLDPFPRARAVPFVRLCASPSPHSLQAAAPAAPPSPVSLASSASAASAASAASSTSSSPSTASNHSYPSVPVVPIVPAADVEVRLGAVLYYEVTITAHAPPNGADDNEEGCVSVGMCLNNFTLSGKQPGWDSKSWGWHGDDGKLFYGSGFPDDAQAAGVTFGTTRFICIIFSVAKYLH